VECLAQALPGGDLWQLRLLGHRIARCGHLMLSERPLDSAVRNSAS